MRAFCCAALVIGASSAALMPSTTVRHGTFRHPRSRVALVGDALLEAAKSGDAAAMQAYLDSGADLSEANQGSMALHVAAARGNAAAVALLLGQGGVDPDVVQKGVTALHSAAFKNHADVIDLLLAAGADPDALQREDGSTALLEASVSGHTASVERLLAGGANPDKGSSAKPLPSAAIKDRRDVVAQLLAAGADPNIAEDDGSTALLKAAAVGHGAVVRLLLEGGADPNVGRGDDPITPLHYAAFGGFEEVVAALLAAGARLDAADAEGSSPLRFALAQSNHARVAHALLQAGAAFEEL